MTRRRRLLYGCAVLLAGAALFDVYARLPSRVAVTPLELKPGTRHAILLFHGRYGEEEPLLQAIEGRMRELAAASGAHAGTEGMNDTTVRRYRWAPHSDNRFRSAVNGERVGAVLGAELAEYTANSQTDARADSLIDPLADSLASQPALESVHLVSHSSGAYLLNPLCEALRKGAGRPLRIEMTYLDPIGFHGVFDAGWGRRNFGTCADYAEAFINTDDPAPATNVPLAHAFNIDVTAVEARTSYTGTLHRWPLQYYLEQLTVADIESGSRSHESRPRGAVERRH